MAERQVEVDAAVDRAREAGPSPPLPPPKKKRMGRPPGSKTKRRKTSTPKKLTIEAQVSAKVKVEDEGVTCAKDVDRPEPSSAAYSRPNRVRKSPTRLSSNKEWSRVMEAPQLKKSSKKQQEKDAVRLKLSRVLVLSKSTVQRSSEYTNRGSIPTHKNDGTLVNNYNYTSVISKKEFYKEKETIKQTAAKKPATVTLTGSGRKSCVPARLSSAEEWKRVMEGQQWGSPSKKKFEIPNWMTKTKRTVRASPSPSKIWKTPRAVEERVRQFPSTATGVERALFLTTPLKSKSPSKQNGEGGHAHVQPKIPEEKCLSLFPTQKEKIVYLVEAADHGISCFYCSAKTTNKWHVFGGKVSCDTCHSSGRKDSAPIPIEGSSERLKNNRNAKSNSSKVATEDDFSSLLKINVSDYTGAELKRIADSENKRLGIPTTDQL